VSRVQLSVSCSVVSYSVLCSVFSVIMFNGQLVSSYSVVSQCRHVEWSVSVVMFNGQLASSYPVVS
jgi:hypothetical protein